MNFCTPIPILQERKTWADTTLILHNHQTHRNIGLNSFGPFFAFFKHRDEIPKALLFGPNFITNITKGKNPIIELSNVIDFQNKEQITFKTKDEMNDFNEFFFKQNLSLQSLINSEEMLRYITPSQLNFLPPNENSPSSVIATINIISNKPILQAQPIIGSGRPYQIEITPFSKVCTETSLPNSFSKGKPIQSFSFIPNSKNINQKYYFECNNFQAAMRWILTIYLLSQSTVFVFKQKKEEKVHITRKHVKPPNQTKSSNETVSDSKTPFSSQEKQEIAQISTEKDPISNDPITISIDDEIQIEDKHTEEITESGIVLNIKAKNSNNISPKRLKKKHETSFYSNATTPTIEKERLSFNLSQNINLDQSIEKMRSEINEERIIPKKFIPPNFQDLRKNIPIPIYNENDTDFISNQINHLISLLDHNLNDYEPYQEYQNPDTIINSLIQKQNPMEIDLKPYLQLDWVNPSFAQNLIDSDVNSFLNPFLSELDAVVNDLSNFKSRTITSPGEGEKLHALICCLIGNGFNGNFVTAVEDINKDFQEFTNLLTNIQKKAIVFDSKEPIINIIVCLLFDRSIITLFLKTLNDRADWIEKYYAKGSLLRFPNMAKIVYNKIFEISLYHNFTFTYNSKFITIENETSNLPSIPDIVSSRHEEDIFSRFYVNLPFGFKEVDRIKDQSQVVEILPLALGSGLIKSSNGISSQLWNFVVDSIIDLPTSSINDNEKNTLIKFTRGLSVKTFSSWIEEAIKIHKLSIFIIILAMNQKSVEKFFREDSTFRDLPRLKYLISILISLNL